LKAETEPNNEIQEAAAGFISEVTGEEVKTENLSKDIIEKYKGMALVKKEDKDALETFKTEKTKLEKESNDAKSEVSKLTTENIQLKADKATLESEVTKLSDNAKIGEATLKNKRSECLRLYKLSVDNKTVPAVESLIEKASSEELDGLLQQYGKGMTEKFTFKCKDCGSAHAEVQSSFVAGKNGGDPDPSKNASVESVSVETIHTNFLKAQKTEKK
jgi:hypothetical protein